MGAYVVLRPVASGYLARLPNRLPAYGRLHADLRADGRSVGGRAHQLDHDPVVAVAVVVIQEFIVSRSSGDKQIQETVVIIVTPGTSKGEA